MVGHAASVAPHVYKVLFENDRVRLLEVDLAPGVASDLHSHPDYLVYAIDGGTVHLAGPSGEGADVTINAGDAVVLSGRSGLQPGQEVRPKATTMMASGA